MSNNTTCICTDEKHGHPSGKPCGKPVENPDTAQSFDRDGQKVGEEFPLGICEECLDKAGIPRKQLADSTTARLVG